MRVIHTILIALLGIISPDGFWGTVLVFHREVTHALPILIVAFVSAFGLKAAAARFPRVVQLGVAIALGSTMLLNPQLLLFCALTATIALVLIFGERLGGSSLTPLTATVAGISLLLYPFGDLFVQPAPALLCC